MDSSETLKYQKRKEVEKGGKLHLKTAAVDAYRGMKEEILSYRQFRTSRNPNANGGKER